MRGSVSERSFGMAEQYRLEMRGVKKTFPGVKALDGVNLRVRPGTVHALMGENGAGKSTLMKCLFGIYKMDEGEVYIDGAQLREDYLPGEAISGEMDAVTVPEGQLFVMGDNREYSEDSRSPRVGTIEQSTIVGKVIVRLYPFNSIKTFKGVDYES